MSLSFFKRQQVRAYKPLNRYLASLNLKPRPMGKKKPSTPGEEYLLLSTPPSTLSIVDTHTHLASTFSNYRSRYKQGKHQTVYDFVRTMYEGRNVESIVDVWCEAPVEEQWKEFADSALNPEDRQMLWGGLEYWFVMGVHPHDAKSYNDQVEKEILKAMAHPRCVGWGEIGLDYHYDNSPRDIQQRVFIQQLRQAVKLAKPLTIHTREADEDTLRILKEEVPKDHRIHVHCFTDTPEFGKQLLHHFPNLYIGITGVITYTSNTNTSDVIREMVAAEQDKPLRILLETDAPYMVPANLYELMPEIRGKKLPICHTAMVPWTAAFVADLAGERWDADRVMVDARENARKMYGV